MQISKTAPIVAALPVVETAPVVAPITQAKKRATKAPAEKVTKPVSAKPKADKKAKAAPVSATAAKFFIQQGARPSAGKLLQAHTEAALIYFGLYTPGATVAKKELIKLIGATAVNYHLGDATRNMQDKGAGVSLTDIGRLTFTQRQAGIDEKATAAYLAIFKTGKADGAMVKNQALIFAA